MLRTLIIGLGRAGLGLHWSVLKRLRDGWPFSDEPALVWDARDIGSVAEEAGLVPVRSLEHARSLVDPSRTIVHVCTPPTSRLDLLRELTELGFNRLLVEKPLALDQQTLGEIALLRRSRGLRMVVVAHWLDSRLTRALHELVQSRQLGDLTSIEVAQLKPRLRRTLATNGHPTAFDVELPHSVGVALRLAGDADVAGAEWTDMRAGDRVIPRMGTALLQLRHSGGPRTEIFSDLASPVRERRIELEFTGGRAVGFFPGSEDDHFAHLRVSADGRETATVFPDDSLALFLRRVYRQFARGEYDVDEFTLNMRVVQLLGAAKGSCRARELAEPVSEEVMGRAS